MVCYLSQKGGGSLISHKPCFSSNAKCLYYGWGSTVREYNAETGDLVREFQLTDIVPIIPDKIIGLSLYPGSKDELVSVSEKGELIVWNLSSHQSSRYTKLLLKKKTDVVVHFVIVPSCTDYSRSDIFLTITDPCSRGKKKAYVAQFCEESGQALWTTYLGTNFSTKSIHVGGTKNNQFLASIQQERLSVVDCKTKQQVTHLIGSERYFTCVVCHPTEQCIATGDNTGRILLWHNIFKRYPAQSVYHWHTLPVVDVIFSENGSHLYSGGGEHVLVKWNVSDSNVKHFLPRLPAPISHVSVSAENTFLSVSTDDNGIHILDSKFHRVSIIQGLSWNISPVPGMSIFPAGLNYDPRTQSLVVNGRSGHLQFYSPQHFKLLFHLDVTMMNVVSQLRDEVIFNPEVTAVAFSSDGLWLGTVQQQYHSNDCSDCTLRFWNYDLAKQEYLLNSSIELENFGLIKKISFQPLTSKTSPSYLAATLGTDCKFRIWTLADDSSIYKEKQAWHCESIGYYHDLSAQDMSFSSDGSLLAVAFGPSLTLWDVDTNIMKSSLTYSKDHLSRVEFAHNECSHLIIGTTESLLIVWDLLSLSVLWMVPVKVSLLITDPYSNHATVITKRNHVFVFEVTSSTPVYYQEDICDKNETVLSALHLPYSTHEALDKSTPSWLLHSQIFFLTSGKKLFAIERSGTESDSSNMPSIPESFNLPLTPFQALVATLSKSDAQKAKPLHHVQFGQPAEAAVRKFLSFPCHTMAPVSTLCNPLLRSFLIYKERKTN
ncbi:unnamed protein product [Bemisia tabaci]|uniref:WD repeat-containing protein 75 second beta-propeller domain-containing protein n=1 Tax=Bemisia tabaci TaxID=7038 RepID=A0A9P0C7Z3_BEMTA|nr:unnamed protein product [Bemisia tabaci]